MDADGASSRFQGVDKSSTAYRLLSSMGWEEGQGLVSYCFLSAAIQFLASQQVLLEYQTAPIWPMREFSTRGLSPILKVGTQQSILSSQSHS